jgi:hypothetical protein
MKRLDIKNFTKRMDDIHSDFFTINYCSNADDKYIIGIDTNDVVSFKPLKRKHYKMSIDKRANEDNRYELWLWDMEGNISYPMSIAVNEISSLSLFTSYLNHILTLAGNGVFDGEPGNMIK